jgi:hypothetical protein
MILKNLVKILLRDEYGKNPNSGLINILSPNQALATQLGQAGDETLIQVCLNLIAYK